MLEENNTNSEVWAEIYSLLARIEYKHREMQKVLEERRRLHKMYKDFLINLGMPKCYQN
jgi:hypothetical protein